MNEDPVRNFSQIVDQMAHYYEKFRENKPALAELLARESTELSSSVLLPFALHEPLTALLQDMGSEVGGRGKRGWWEKAAWLEAGVASEVETKVRALEEAGVLALGDLVRAVGFK